MAARKAGNLLVAPVFTRDHAACAAFFRELQTTDRGLWDGLTGAPVVLTLPEERVFGDKKDVYEAIHTQTDGAVKFEDLPCLYLCDDGSQAVVPLHENGTEFAADKIRHVMHRLLDGVKKGYTVADLQQHLDTTPPPKETRWFYAVVALGCLLALVALVGLLVWQLPRIHQYRLGALTFAVYAFIGLVSAVLLFGALKSAGSIRGNKFGAAFEFGGPAALLVMVVLAGTAFELYQSQNSFDVSVFLVEPGQPNTLVKAPGSITLKLDPPLTAEAHNGVVTFRGVPPGQNGKAVGYTIDFPGYSVKDPPSTITLSPNAHIDLGLEKR